MPLYGNDLNAAMFKQTTGIGSFQIFDPRVIFDNRANRFWIVAMELAADNVFEGPYRGRIHIAVSKNATPNNCGTGTEGWYKYTQGGNGGAALDPMSPTYGTPLAQPPNVEPLGAFPDRPTITVDEKYLYITIRKGIRDVDWYHSVSYVMVIDKTPMLTGGAGSIEFGDFLDNAGNDKTVGHCLFVDDDIVVDNAYKVYTLCLPRVQTTDIGSPYTSLWFGALQYFPATHTIGFNTAELTIPDLDPTFNEYFRGASTSAPEGPGGDSDINQSTFWNACTRRVGGARRLWAIHHVRSYGNQSEISSKLQWYRITPNNFPSGTPVIDVIRRKDRGADTWCHDGSIGVNASGDAAVSYTRSYDLSGMEIPFGWPDFCVWMVPANGAESDTIVVNHRAASVAGPGWADFSGTVPDRTDSCIFWGHSNVSYDSDQWESFVAKYTIPGCGAGRPGGDMDGDGELGLGDLVLFQELAAESSLDADLNGDGTVDVLDFVLLLNQSAAEF